MLQSTKPFIRKPAVIIGRHPTNNEMLATYGETFVLLAAPPGSGKGVGIISPNLLTYPDSVVVNDPKGENWLISAGFRESCGHECFLFSPHSLSTHRYNPFDYIRRDELYRLGDAKKMASIWFQPDNPKNKGFFSQAGNIFASLILYLMECPDLPCCPPEVYKLIAKGAGLSDWAQEVIDMRREAGNPLTEETELELQRIITSAANKSGFPIVLGILDERLAMFGEKTVAYATSASDFDFRDLRKKRMSIYFSVPSAELKKFSLLMNLFFTQAIQENSYVEPKNGGVGEDGEYILKYQTLFVMDEAAVMGPIEVLKTAPALMRSYNIRFLIICQNKQQLRSDDLYGREGADAIMKAFHIEVVFAPSDISDAEEYSRNLGTDTTFDTNINQSKGDRSKSINLQNSKVARPLMLPQELKMMPYDQQIIYVQGTKTTPPIVIKSRKIFYYEDEVLKSRANLSAPFVPTATNEDLVRILNKKSASKLPSYA